MSACARTVNITASPAGRRAICKHSTRTDEDGFSVEDPFPVRTNDADHDAGNATAQIRLFYGAMWLQWGPQNWWPAHSRMEVVVGAYLTQNTAWTNVEKAIASLRQAGRLDLAGLREVSLAELEALVRPSGFFRQKAQRIKLFIEFLDEQYGGSLDRMFAQPTDSLRRELLTLPGVGQETADSILLYAGGHPVAVVDVYLRRILARHGIEHPGDNEKASYEKLRLLVQDALAQYGPVQDGQAQDRLRMDAASRAAPAEMLQGTPATPEPRHEVTPMSALPRSPAARRYNEFHALIVRVGHQLCRPGAPRCQACPLEKFLIR